MTAKLPAAVADSVASPCLELGCKLPCRILNLKMLKTCSTQCLSYFASHAWLIQTRRGIEDITGLVAITGLAPVFAYLV